MEKDLDGWFHDYLDQAKSNFTSAWDTKVTSKETIRNFKLIRTLGAGSFGRVMLASYQTQDSNRDEKPYAIKILNKAKLVKMRQIEHTINEKRILQSINNIFIIQLYMAFKDTTNLYMVMEFVNGGELFNLLRKKGRFSEDQSKFYAAQVLLALQYLHHCNILYRDLKPENILIDHTGFLKIADFGFAKRVAGNGHTWTLCGTPQYLAPEIILSRSYGKSVDYWALGILIYEMTAGVVPFDHPTPIKLYELIVACEVRFPFYFRKKLCDLISHLVVADVTKRYGNLKDGAMDIIKHPWFSDIDFRAVLKRTLRPPWMPKVKGPMDSSMFDVYKEEPISITKTDKHVSEFADF